MPLRLEVKKQLVQRTDRVKGVDLHPTEPWLLANLYNGNVYLWNYNDSTLVKSFEVTELPVRASKFVARKGWIVAGADDMNVRVYNYNTMDKVKTFEAHQDYIRSIAVHPSLPVLLTSSDDMLIKLWDWDKGWACTQVFEGHSHYVMMVTFNPKDTNTFASASLDRTIKVWSLGQPTPNFTLEGHEKGVNCVDYFNGGDRPFLISGADDRLVKVWDYQTKACVQTLEGHAHNISSACFHPELPIILTGSEDGTVRMWHATTYRLENTLNYGMERCWSVCCIKGSNNVGLGFDEGAVVVKIGREEPVASMDSSGKIIWARHNEVQTANVKALGADIQLGDGERLPLAIKDLGACDLYPQSLQHNPNSRFVTVCGDGEFVVYTALAWRNKAFGSALEFVWSADSNEYAVREAGGKVKVFKNFAEKLTIKVEFAVQGLHGGALVGVRSADFVCFYDWNDGRLVRRIDVACKSVHWSENGELVAIVGDAGFYILQFSRAAVDEAIASGAALEEDGVEEAFELIAEVPERVRTGLWVGDCFIYNNAAWRLNYCVGGEVTTMCHLDRPMYLLGYLAAQSRVYLIDRDFAVVSFTLLLSLIEFKTLIMRGDASAAFALLPNIPKEQYDGIARFLEAKGLVSEALDIATDANYKFDLAVQLGDLDVARDIAAQLDTEAKWRQLGELAMAHGQLEVAQDCLHRATDYSGMMLMYSAQGDRAGMQALAAEAQAAGKHNVAFLALFLLGRVEECVSLLMAAGRLPEAAFFARTYLPSKMSQAVQEWKRDLASISLKAADALADPSEYPNLFPDLPAALEAEAAAARERAAMDGRSYQTFAAAAGGATDAVIGGMKAMGLGGVADSNGGSSGMAGVVAGAASTLAGAFGGRGQQEEAQQEEEEDDDDLFHEPAAAHSSAAAEPEWQRQQQQPYSAVDPFAPSVDPFAPAPAAANGAAAAAAAAFDSLSLGAGDAAAAPATYAAPVTATYAPATAYAPPPVPAAPAAAPGLLFDGAGEEDEDDFGFDEPVSGVGAGAEPAVDLDDDWGLDGEDEDA